MTNAGSRLGGTALTRGLTKLAFLYKNAALEQELLGIHFPNPIGLAAGFDKNAHLVDIMPSVGFGWMEVGSITARPCAGNPKPRLQRLPSIEALVVYYGLMNDGCDRIKERLQAKRLRIPVGTSIAPTNDEQTMDYRKAIEDYAYSYRELAEIGSYTTLNLSCPNTCNDQPFIDPVRLGELLRAITAITTSKPIFLKLSPDLTDAQLDAILEVAKKHGVAGIICTNLSKKRTSPLLEGLDVPEHGGLSGKVVAEKSDAMISHIATRWPGDFIIVGCGGVYSAEDAYRKIKLGASLIQMVTGMIYQGPQVIGQINQGLVELLHRDGYHSLHQAVGVDVSKQTT